MAIRFVSDRIWIRIRKSARSAKRRALVAVPFIGRGAADQLPLRRGDVLVTKFDRPSIRAGLIDPREIVAFIKRGVEVHTIGNLHAKVYVFGRTAFVASANISALSEHHLIEAGSEVIDRAFVDDCRAFVRGLTGDVVELEFARRQIPFYRPPHIPAGLNRGKRSGRARPTDLVAVSLSLVEYDERDSSAAAKAHSAARRHVRNRERFRLDDFRWKGRPSKALKKHVRVLMCTKDSRGGTRVTAPARVLELRRYRSSQGSERTIVVVEVRKFIRDKSLAAVLRALGPIGRSLRSVRGVRPLRDISLVYKLGQLWPKVS
jgi:hypothetical protein